MSINIKTEKSKAVALCRVSSDEQLKNNSLARQNESVMEMAKKLGVIVPKDYIWSGSVSSKCGKNIKRKDLNEIYDTCKKDKTVRYIIVDEPDRFMRSIAEAFYWETEFKQVGVRVIYTDEELNTDDASGKLLRFLKYFQAEGSNEERIKKAVNGHAKALRDGRYTFQPPLGYMRGQSAGIHEINPDYGIPLKHALTAIADGTMTIKEALNWYNENCTEIALGKHGRIKLDKWRKFIVNPYYAGIVEMNKKIKVKNEHGLHTPLITLEQHKLIVEAVEGHRKLHKGPKKGGNPRFPLNQILLCEDCQKLGNTFKFTGYDNTNGKTKKIYSRYFCRGCSKSLSRGEAHQQVEKLISRLDFSKKGKESILKALNNIWNNEEAGIRSELGLQKRDLTELNQQKNIILDQILDEKNEDLKDIYRERLKAIGEQTKKIESRIRALEHELARGRSDFLDFALDFIDNMGTHFLDLPLEEVGVCKNILFPSGFWVDANKKVYTLEISPLYRERTKKKDAETSKNALVVGREGLEPPTSSV